MLQRGAVQVQPIVIVLSSPFVMLYILDQHSNCYYTQKLQFIIALSNNKHQVTKKIFSSKEAHTISSARYFPNQINKPIG